MPGSDHLLRYCKQVTKIRRGVYRLLSYLLKVWTTSAISLLQLFSIRLPPPHLLTIAFILLPLMLFILFCSSPFSLSPSPTYLPLHSPFHHLAFPLSSPFHPFAKCHSFSISKNLHIQLFIFNCPADLVTRFPWGVSSNACQLFRTSDLEIGWCIIKEEPIRIIKYKLPVNTWQLAEELCHRGCYQGCAEARGGYTIPN